MSYATTRQALTDLLYTGGKGRIKPEDLRDALLDIFDAYAVEQVNISTGSSNALQKGNGSGGLADAVSGTDFLAPDAVLNSLKTLTDPSADKLIMWDDSASNFVFVTLGAGLELSGTTLRKYETIPVAASDETTALTTGTAKTTFRMPYALTLTDVRASLTTAQTSGSIFTVDINEAGTSVLSTKLTLDNGEKTSQSAAAAEVISDTALADDAEITIDIDQVGDGTAAGLKVYLVGYRT